MTFPISATSCKSGGGNGSEERPVTNCKWLRFHSEYKTYCSQHRSENNYQHKTFTTFVVLLTLVYSRDRLLRVMTSAKRTNKNEEKQMIGRPGTTNRPGILLPAGGWA